MNVEITSSSSKEIYESPFIFSSSKDILECPFIRILEADSEACLLPLILVYLSCSPNNILRILLLNKRIYNLMVTEKHIFADILKGIFFPLIRVDYPMRKDNLVQKQQDKKGKTETVCFITPYQFYLSIMKRCIVPLLQFIPPLDPESFLDNQTYFDFMVNGTDHDSLKRQKKKLRLLRKHTNFVDNFIVV